MMASRSSRALGRYIAAPLLVIVTGALSGCVYPDANAQLLTSTQSPPPSQTPSSATYPAPAPAPTLSPDKQEAYLLNLLRSNGDCELSCWWGIQPGRTSWRNAAQAFAPLGMKGLSSTNADGTIEHDFPLSVNQSNLLNLAITLVEENDFVQSIDVQADNIQSFPNFSAAMRSYRLDRVLTQYGEPSSVLLGLQAGRAEPDSPFTYSLAVVFKTFWIWYTGPALQGEVIQVCPRFDAVNSIGLHLQALEVDLSALEQDQLKPLGSSSNITLRQFYENFRMPDSQFCFESPARIWPP